MNCVSACLRLRPEVKEAAAGIGEVRHVSLSSAGGAKLGFPDVVIAGAARSGTSTLAARLSQHPGVDGGSIKEPNYFSHNLSKGADWYDNLFMPRREGLLRLDASMAYTAPQNPQALGALASAAPDARIIYAVREPLARAISHYRLLRYYFEKERHPNFGDAIREDPVYLGVSDYRAWLELLQSLFGASRVLVVPFPVITSGSEATDEVFKFLGIEPVQIDADSADVHRNQVVAFRHPAAKIARKALRRVGAYPWLRRSLGPRNMRLLRGIVTRTPPSFTDAEALASCTPEQRREIERLVERSCSAVADVLEAQDARRGLAWRQAWLESL